MVHTMNSFQAPKREMRVHLRSGNVRVAKDHLHAAQVRAMLHHVRGATVPQPMRTGRLVRQLDQMPHPLAREWHTAQREKKARNVLPDCARLAA